MNFTEKEFAKKVILAHLIDYESKSNDDYEFNDEKCDKMNDIIAYCQTLEKDHGYKIIRCVIEPRYEQGSIQVLFNGEFILGNREHEANLQDFIKTLGLCDGVNITTNPVDEDMFQITFFVDNLWVKKPNSDINSKSNNETKSR